MFEKPHDFPWGDPSRGLSKIECSMSSLPFYHILPHEYPIKYIFWICKRCSSSSLYINLIILKWDLHGLHGLTIQDTHVHPIHYIFHLYLQEHIPQLKGGLGHARALQLEALKPGHWAWTKCLNFVFTPPRWYKFHFFSVVFWIIWSHILFTSTESMNLLYLLLFQDYDGTQKQLTECWVWRCSF